MMKNCAILLALCALHITFATTNDGLTLEIESDELMKTGDLEQAETKDASATEIIKQIRKLNPDGTFTIGFEANDGSFKIETRDLQGNVKQGTYGYVDENGEVKRVSYSLQNNTLLKDYQQKDTTDSPSSSSSSSSVEKDDENETISIAQSSRYNRTASFASTTRRPASLAFLTSTTNKPFPSQQSVVQAIPRKRLLNSLDKDKDRSTVPFDGTTTVVYATSVPTPKPYHSRSTTSPTYSTKKHEKGVEIDQVERKVFIATAQKESASTTKPIISKSNNNNEKGDEKLDLLKRGNALRRQLKADLEENIEAQQQVLYGDGDESSAIYGSSYGNVRPLFTTQQPKIPLQVLAARQRATQLQNILANSSPGTTSSAAPAITTTTEKVYTKAPKRQSKIKLEDVQPDIANENYLVAQQEQFPAAPQPTENDERRAFQRPLPPHLEGLYRPRNYLRQLQQQPPQQQIPNGVELQDFRQGLPPQGLSQNNQRFAQQQLSSQQLYPEQQQASDFFGIGRNSFYPQRNPYGGGNDYDRPLTIRDFERLLQVLVNRQSSPRFGVNPLYPASNPLGYPPFVPNGYNGQNPYSQIPRPPFFNNNPFSSGLYDPGYQNPYYSPSMPIGQQADIMQEPNQDIQQQRFPQQRRRQYNSRFFSPQQSAQQQQQTQLPTPPMVAPSEQEISYNSLQGPVDNYLPPSVREQLLYRMLMLALRGESPQQQQQYIQPLMPSASSVHSVLEPEQQETTTILKSTSERTAVSKKPVRSVQILGEEEAEDDTEE